MRVRNTPSDQPAAVCIRAPNWVGDVVMATPAFRAIRRHFSSSQVTVVIRESVAPVLRGAPWFDRCIVTRRSGRWRAAEFLRCVAAIRGARCEVAFALPNSFSSALMLRLAGVPHRVGYARGGRRFMLTRALERPSLGGRLQPTYMADYYLALCEAAGVQADGTHTELPFAGQDIEAADAILARAGLDLARPLALLHPGAAFGPSKLWSERNFATLAGMLQEEFGVQTACVGAPAEGPIVRRIARAGGARVFDLTGCGIDLHLLKCVVARSMLLVTTDSGPRHYGVALGVPTVCLMGPTHPGYSTSGRPCDHVVRVDVECGPCQRKVCNLDHRCMELLTPSMVMATCTEALRARQSSA